MERFWNRSAGWNIRRAIYDAAAVSDPAHGAEAFDQGGSGDAARLAAFVHPDMRVVELGCGIGRIMKPLAGRCREIIGFDISDAMIQGSREYLAGIPNARVEKTAGSSLPTLADASVDFLYSVLCFIHVDKRSAFRYFREIQRVLVQNGLALLQFENILSPKGMQEFVRVVDLEHEYPLEFYSLQELEVLLPQAGLEILSTDAYEQFIDVHVVNGSAERWSEQCRTEIVPQMRTSGVFREEPFILQGDGEIVAEMHSRLAEPRVFRLAVRIRSPHGSITIPEQVVPLSPRESLTFTLRYVAARGDWQVLLDGRKIPHQGAIPPGEPGVLECALIPSGFGFDERLPREFPNLCLSAQWRAT